MTDFNTLTIFVVSILAVVVYSAAGLLLLSLAEDRHPAILDRLHGDSARRAWAAFLLWPLTIAYVYLKVLRAEIGRRIEEAQRPFL